MSDELTDDELLAQIDSELASLTDLEVAQRAFETTKGLWLVATKKCIEKDKRIQSLDEQLRAATDEIDRQIMLVDAARELAAHRLEQLASLKGESQ